MRKPIQELTLVAALALTLFVAMKRTARAAEPLKPQDFTWETHKKGQTKYLIYLPKDYDATVSKRWPLMLFLHGAGERGTDLSRVAIHGPPSLVKQGKSFPFIIVAPQCPDSERWATESLVKLLDHIIATHAVDTNRVYLTGLSMGGYGTWALGLACPERFAAIAPICGGGNFIDAFLGAPSHAEALRTLPVWAFHGAKDLVVPLEESERMVNVLKHKAGCLDVKLTVYPEAEHNSWTQTYANPDFYDWLLQHSRAKVEAKK